MAKQWWRHYKKYNPDNKLKVVGYGSPVFQVDDFVGGQKTIRFRHEGDPVSMLDDGAISDDYKINPSEAHDYGGYNKQNQPKSNNNKQQLLKSLIQ